MKKLAVLILVLLGLLGSGLALAAENYVVDEISTLDSNELAELNEQAKNISLEYGLEVAVILKESCEGKNTVEYTEQYYAENGYQVDGLMLLINYQFAESYIYVSGQAQQTFTEEQISNMKNAYLEADTYYGGFKDFLDLTETYLIQANNSPPEPTEPTTASEQVLVVDGASVLEESQLNELTQQAQKLNLEYGLGVMAVLQPSSAYAGQDLAAYVEQTYLGNSYLTDGLLLFVDTDTQVAEVFFEGRAEHIFTEEQTVGLKAAYGSSNSYYQGIKDFFNLLDSSLQEQGTQPIPTERQLELLVDQADLLTAEEEVSLLAKLEEISQRQQCDVVIVTVDSLDGKTSTAYADDFYDYNGYGYGENRDGILFLISMGERDWAISTCGYGIEAFTDYDQEYIMSQVKPALSEGDFNTAFNSFADYCDELLIQAHSSGEAYDVNSSTSTYDYSYDYSYEYSGFPLLSLFWGLPYWMYLLALGIGAIIAHFIMKKKKSGLDSIRPESGASSYIVPDSLKVISGDERFLYKNVSVRAKPKDTDSGGGSSTHYSSSGTSHGGSSGKF